MIQRGFRQQNNEFRHQNNWDHQGKIEGIWLEATIKKVDFTWLNQQYVGFCQFSPGNLGIE